MFEKQYQFWTAERRSTVGKLCGYASVQRKLLIIGFSFTKKKTKSIPGLRDNSGKLFG